MLLSKVLLAITAATLASSYPLVTKDLDGNPFGALDDAIAKSPYVEPANKMSKRTSSWVGVDIGTVTSVSSGSISGGSNNAYNVVSGDTGSLIAQKLGVSVASLAAANPGVNWTNMLVGQPIVIPGSSSTPSSSTGSDIASAIANQLGVGTSDLTNANPNVNWFNLQGGQSVNVPQTDGTTVPYTLSLGDVAQNIANSLGITYAQLIAANPGVDFSSLQPGQSIKVPANVAQIIDPSNYPSGSGVSTTSATTTASDTGVSTGGDDTSSTNGDASSDTASNAGDDTSSQAGSDDQSDTQSDAGSDAGSDTASNAGSDDGSDNASDAGSDAGSDTASNAGSDTGSNDGSDTASTAGSNTSSSAGMRFRKRLHRHRRDEATRFTVQAGQTGEQIADLLGVPYQALEDVNPNIDFDSLTPGQILRIPRIANIVLRDAPTPTEEWLDALDDAESPDMERRDVDSRDSTWASIQTDDEDDDDMMKRQELIPDENDLMETSAEDQLEIDDENEMIKRQEDNTMPGKI